MARIKKNIKENNLTKCIAIDDIKATINNKNIVAKSGEELELSFTELLFLKDKVELC